MVAYIDDLAIVTTGRNKIELEAAGNRPVAMIGKWIVEKGLNLTP